MNDELPETINLVVRTMLRQSRIDRELRQSDLAAMLNVPQSFVSKYELGDRALSFGEVKLICTCLGISFVEFVNSVEVKCGST